MGKIYRKQLKPPLNAKRSTKEFAVAGMVNASLTPSFAFMS
jgi:hypothetical protein